MSLSSFSSRTLTQRLGAFSEGLSEDAGTARPSLFAGLRSIESGDLQLSRRTQQFRLPETERAYKEWVFQHKRGIFRWVSVAALTLVIVSFLGFGEVVHEEWRYFAAIRAVSCAGMAMLVFAVWREVPLFIRHYQTFIIVLVLVHSLGLQLQESFLWRQTADEDENDTETFMLFNILVVTVVTIISSPPIFACTVLVAAIQVGVSTAAHIAPPTWLYVAFLAVGVAAVRTCGALTLVDRRTFLHTEKTERDRLLLVDEETRGRRVLEQILPRAMIRQLQQGVQNPVEIHENAVVVFADIIGFTPMCSRLSARELTKMLGTVMSEIDSLCDKRGLVKLFTVGDAYGALCKEGDNPGEQCQRAVAFAMDVQASLKTLLAMGRIPHAIEMRFGAARGPLATGVIGSDLKFSFGARGEALSNAIANEGRGAAAGILVDAEVAAFLAGDAPLFHGLQLRLGGHDVVLTDSDGDWLIAPLGKSADLPHMAQSTPRMRPMRGRRATGIRLDESVPVSVISSTRAGPDHASVRSVGPPEDLMESYVPRWAVFGDPEIEAEFRDALMTRNRQLMLGSGIMMLMLWVSFIVVDQVPVDADRTGQSTASERMSMLAARMVGLVAAGGALLGWQRAVSQGRWPAAGTWFFGMVACLVLAQLATMAVAPLDVEDFVDRAQFNLMILFVLTTVESHQPLARSLALSVLLFLGAGALYTARTEGDRGTTAMLTLAIFSSIAVIAKTMALRSEHELFQTMRVRTHANDRLAAERAATEALLSNVMPDSIIAQLKNGAKGVIAEESEGVTVLFARLEGLPEGLPGLDVLNTWVTAVDGLVQAGGMAKIKVFESTYMAAVNLDDATGSNAAVGAVKAALTAAAIRDMPQSAEGLAVHLGLHSGRVSSGVIGTARMAFDILGDTVNVASRYCTLAGPGDVLCTEATATLVRDGVARQAELGELGVLDLSQLDVVDRGVQTIKGKGLQKVAALQRRR